MYIYVCVCVCMLVCISVTHAMQTISLLDTHLHTCAHAHIYQTVAIYAYIGRVMC